MKKLLLVLATVGLFTVSAFAQNSAVKANVPFDFSVAGVEFTAGQYSIDQVNMPGLVAIRDESGRTRAFLIANQTYRADGEEAPAFVFNRYGDRYFLARVWRAGSTGSELQKSRIEKELLSSSVVRPEQVLVAAVYPHR